jgi:hypothetical protein
METKKEFNSSILKTTMTIAEKFPELSKYIEEMPIDAGTNNTSEITIKDLKNYDNSLNALLKKYTADHNA